MNILEIQLLSTDIPRTKKFYNEILGMEILYADDSSVKFSAGLSTLVFKKASKNDPFYHFAFNIPANKFEEAHEWASEKVQLLPIASTSTVADFKNWNAKAFYFYDNNHNIVELIARFGLENNSDRPFDGSSIYSISEMGIVVNNAKDYSRMMLEAHSLSFFSRQPPMDDFAAIGDDNGLFIVVNDKRNWYPTRKPSGKYWASVKFKQGEKITCFEMTGSEDFL
ncbi:MAG: VOC family protein [Chitinophagaceae bacterium]